MSALFPASDFNPTDRTVDPPNPPDQMAEAVLASLSRGRFGYSGRPWGVVKTFVLSAVSLGILPLLCWPRRMRNFMVWEQQQLWHLAEWLRLRTGRPEAVQLRDQLAADVGPAPIANVMSLALPILAVIAFVHLASVPAFNPRELWLTSWHVHHHEIFYRAQYFYTPLIGELSLILSAGYLFYWWHICRHAAAMEAYVDGFNAITAQEGVAPVVASGVGFGFSPLWAFAALVGLSRGAIWAIPLAMAGVVQMRYISFAGRRTRADLAARVREMLARTRPALDVRPTPRTPVSLCINEKCRAPLRPGSTFCTRCGARTA
jgi:hypothetical protein